MRKINKGNPHQPFSNYVAKHKPVNWEDMDGAIKRDSRNFIMQNEQVGLCGYTELPLNIDNSHIDHYKKRNLFPQLTFDWTNLIVAAVDDEFGANFKDNGYSIKAAEYSEIFNPVLDHSENYFSYTEWGEIVAKEGITNDEKEKAEKTIEIFNLKHPSLKSRRFTIIQMVKSCREQFTKQELLQLFNGQGFKSVIELFT